MREWDKKALTSVLVIPDIVGDKIIYHINIMRNLTRTKSGLKRGCWVPLYLMLLATLGHCEESDDVNIRLFHGYIPIHCDFGPYYLHINSILDPCGSVGALPQEIKRNTIKVIQSGQLPIDNLCPYDNNEGKLGSETLFDLKIERSGLTFQIDSDFQTRSISGPLQVTDSLGNTTLDGFEVLAPKQTFRVYITNVWVGGCLHDIMLWELEEQE